MNTKAKIIAAILTTTILGTGAIAMHNNQPIFQADPLATPEPTDTPQVTEQPQAAELTPAPKLNPISEPEQTSPPVQEVTPTPVPTRNPSETGLQVDNDEPGDTQVLIIPHPTNPPQN